MVANIMMISFPIADFIVTLSLRERRLINAAVVGEFWAPRAVCLDYSHRAATSSAKTASPSMLPIYPLGIVPPTIENRSVHNC